MEFRILGPLELVHLGRRIELERSQRRVLLAVLLVHANQVVSVDRLVDVLWGDKPPAGALSTLHAHISRLRKALKTSDTAQPLVRRAPGYVLEVPDDQIDVSAFEGLLAEGRRALDSGNAARAASRLRDALALWRGPALSDFAGMPFADVEIARLEELRLVAFEERVEADLLLGRHTEVAGELERAVADHPLRERLWGQRILALYRAGRQAEALRAYSVLRGILGDELGITPSRALQQLEEAVVLQKAEIDWTPSSRPVQLGDVPEGGAPAPLGESSGVVPGEIASSREAVPLVSPLLRPVAEGFVGRAAELDWLMEQWERAGRGQATLAFLAGEPGMGKTRLASELARRVDAGGGTVLYGRCGKERLVPYEPFVEALRHLVRTQAPPQVPNATGRGRGIGQLLPELLHEAEGHPVASDADPEWERYLLFEAVNELLAQAARTSSVLLVLDDLHWGDRATLALLARTIDALERSSILILATYRPSDLDHSHPLRDLLAESHRSGDAPRLVLEGLDDNAVHALLTSTVPAGRPAPSERLAAALRRETGGNPFFLREVARQLSPGGTAEMPRSASSGDVEFALPATVREFVSRRISHLSDAAQRLLSVAAVAGREFEVAVVESVTGLVDELVLDALDEASASQLVHEVPGVAERYAFDHAIVREAIYEEFSRTRRARLHLRIGEVLEGMGRVDDHHVGSLAHHFWRAAASGGGGVAKAYTYSLAMAARSQAVVAHEEAIRYYRRALELAANGPGTFADVPDVKLGLAELHELRGEYQEAVSLYGAVLESSPDVRAWRGLAAVHRKQGRYSDALVVLDQAFVAVAVDVTVGPLWLERSWTLVTIGEIGAAIEAAEEGLRTAGDDGEVMGQLLLQLARARGVQGDLVAALDRACEARAMFERMGISRYQPTALRLVGDAQFRLGRHDEAAKTLVEGLEMARRYGNVEEVGGCLVNLGLVQLALGSLDEAIECDLGAIAEFERIGHGSGRATAHANLGEKLDRAGRYDEALDECRKALELAREMGHTVAVAFTTDTVATIRMHQNRFDEAAELAEESADLFAEAGADLFADNALRLAAEAWHRGGNPGRAAAASARIRATSERDVAGRNDPPPALSER